VFRGEVVSHYGRLDAAVVAVLSQSVPVNVRLSSHELSVREHGLSRRSRRRSIVSFLQMQCFCPLAVAVIEPLRVHSVCPRTGSLRLQEKAPSPDRPRPMLRSISTVQRMVDAQRADEMSGEAGLAATLQQITDATMPAPRYVKYHERHLQRHLSLLGNYPPRC